jgi:rod shape determining protein RodA
MNQRPFDFIQRFDYILFTAMLLLVVFGILMIASATQDAIDPDLINRVPDQIRFALVGLVAMIVLTFVDYRLLGGLHMWLYAGMVILLLLTSILGVEGDAGAQRWLNIGIRVQPSEIAKIVLIVTLATFFARRYKQLDSVMTIFKSLLHVGFPAFLVFIQPDLGTTIVLLVIWAVVIWAAGIRLRHIALLGLVGALSLPLLLTQLEPYQLARFTTFLFEDSDPDAQYNIDQALISVGSGGVFGKGYASGPQNTGRFLRVRHTDFIFSVIAHEFGFVGSVVTMALLALVIMRILRAAYYASDPLGSMICYGVASVVFFQSVVSIGMNLRLVPVTGLTLPFVSSGGTSLLFTMIGIGLVQSVVVRRRKLTL